MSDVSAVVRLENVVKTFHQGPVEIPVLQGVSLAIEPSQRVAIVGASGAGKSTLLHLMGGLDKPTGGVVKVHDESLAGQSEAALAAIRNRSLGFVYQFHHLLAEFSALENVAMPLLIRGESAQAARAAAKTLLAEVGLAERLHHKPGEMSGGERQRAAVARAMVTRPSCLLADEPTGNLDEHNSAHIYELMLKLNVDYQTALVVVTHDRALARKMDRCLEMRNGVLVELS
ncbi:MAG: lipoprotein-releasing ABC transporter ATP-binding protein LolD [Wenzhouxiangella sp.]|jgi:lipoprotein-releasing system ATP-binding protein|nr:lipoprotein-releasing ABC transporter ATP-binding protein LolD [Wenzhouxiangella sp.]MDR9452821.1 lipoprotein-releasing ABC transporter ATP-binding protein LolD [Wenzhouxiangella sp.]